VSQKISPKPLPGQTGGQHPLARFVDHSETYGPQVIERFVRRLSSVGLAVDLGAGHGRDLAIVSSIHPEATTVGVEAGQEYAGELQGKVNHIYVLDIERETLPFRSATVDLVIANQVLEHTKEVFWIFHEVTRCLKLGGHFIFGVPNIASFHNRLLLLLGRHPTQHKMVSAHVRPFSKADAMLFLNACFPGGYRMIAFEGSQFYPFPPRLARLLAKIFPTAAFSIFFMLQKTAEYSDEFATYPARAQLETNFWTGGYRRRGQYHSTQMDMKSQES
jgi:SAM-dependent methyltransferase